MAAAANINYQIFKIMNAKELNLLMDFIHALQKDAEILSRIGDTHAADIIKEEVDTFLKRCIS